MNIIVKLYYILYSVIILSKRSSSVETLLNKYFTIGWIYKKRKKKIQKVSFLI